MSPWIAGAVASGSGRRNCLRLVVAGLRSQCATPESSFFHQHDDYIITGIPSICVIEPWTFSQRCSVTGRFLTSFGLRLRAICYNQKRMWDAFISFEQSHPVDILSNNLPVCPIKVEIVDSGDCMDRNGKLARFRLGCKLLKINHLGT